jgi:hypothetical protein
MTANTYQNHPPSASPRRLYGSPLRPDEAATLLAVKSSRASQLGNI